MNRSLPRKPVLVTGANGFLGKRTVASLLRGGHAVRAFVLPNTNVDEIRVPGVEIVFGDVAEPGTLELAFEGIGKVVHTAADTTGTEEGGRLTTIQGTQHVLNLAERYQVERLVYISSCSVYGVSDYEPHQLVGEDAALERFPELRGPYSWAKFEAEKLVRSFMSEGRVPIVCLRPGMIYGPGGNLFTPMIGFSFRKRIFAVIGDGAFILPLAHVENVAEAILLALENEESKGRIYNLVDPDRVDKRTYVEVLVRSFYPGARVLFVPFGPLEAAVFLQEKLSAALGRKPVLTRYRLASSQKPVIIDASRITRELDWHPQMLFERAAEELLGE